MPIEGDLYAYLKFQSRLRVSVAWRYRGHVQECIPFFDSVDWDLTILNIHNGNLPGSLVTSVSMCADHAYRVKVLHGMLPTAVRLLVTHPDLYHDDLCPHCLQVAESFAHLWRCPHSVEAVAEMVDRGSVLFWKLARGAQYRAVFAETGIFPGPHSVFDVIQGVVPVEWAKILRGCGISAKGACSVAMKVGKFFVLAAHDEIWRPQCEAQVEHEQRCLITQKAKVGGQVQAVRPPRGLVLGLRLPISHMRMLVSVQYVSYLLLPILGGGCPPLVAQAPVLADSLLQSHYQSVCVLSSVYNPSKELKVLDSTGGDIWEQ